jgi:hypothetical protein
MANPWDKDPIVRDAPAKAAPKAAPSPWDADPVVSEARSNVPNGVVDTVDAYGRGIAKAAMLGFGDEIGAGARWLGGKLLPWRDEVTYDEALQEVRGSDQAVADRNPVADVAGSVTGAVGLGVGLARAGLSPTAVVANRGGGWAATTGASAAEGAILGGAQGFGQGEGVDDRISQAGTGMGAGMLVGAALPTVVTGVTGAARRLVTPNSTSPARQAAVSTLAREGVETTAGQATGSNTLRYAESEIGGQAAQDLIERQGEQFTAAALRRAGVNANRATPDVIDDAFNRIGQQFDDLASRNILVPDRQLQTDLVDTWRNYMSVTPPSARAPIVAETMKDVNKVLKNGGALDGKAYQSLRSRLDRAARGNRDPELANTLRDIRSSLDDAMERSIAARNPGDSGAWKEARNQYRNMLVIEQSATGAGENAAQGIISPSSLRSATVGKQGRRNYARGKGDFSELARAGESVMKAMPQSGTAPRTAVRNLGAAVPAVLGGIAGTSTGGVGAGLVGAAAGAALPSIVGRMMMSPSGQAYLKNQLLSGSLNPQTRAGIVAAINQIDANFLPGMMEGEASQIPAAAAR